MLDRRLIIVGAQSLPTQLSLVRRAGRLPRLTAYGLQNLACGFVGVPFYWAQRLLVRAPRTCRPDVHRRLHGVQGPTFLMDHDGEAARRCSARNTFTWCPRSSLILGWLWKRVLPDLPNRFIDPTPVNAADAQEFDLAMWRLTPDLPIMQMGANIELSKACENYANSKPTAKHKRLCGAGWCNGPGSMTASQAALCPEDA